jgi:LCP family protein required for cell wall assembly
MSHDDENYPEPRQPRRGYGSRRPEQNNGRRSSPPQPGPGRGAEPDYRRDPYRPPEFHEAAAEAWTPGEPARSRSSARAQAAAAAPGHVNADLDLDELDPKGRAARSAKKRRRAAETSRKKKALKYTALGTGGVVAAVVGVGAYVVSHLDGNIKHTALLPSGVTQQAEIPDKFGNTAMNVLLIGTDARVTAADCKLGGDCDTAGNGNSDVLMVIHLAADRTNSTIMSIPRDTETTIPNCGSNASYYGQINSSLAYGASCTVATIHQLTGLTIDHYAEVDFSGVVTMSDALGGVPVCVSNTMHDADSGLRLNAGTTTIEGQQALEFVRTRHGFYDGSDLGREKAQHIFLSSMIRTLRSQASFTNLGNLYTIANAATKSLQVDDGLAGVSNLISLFDTMNKVPTDRVTFVTMPWELDPNNTNRVIANDSESQEMFANIKNDVPYSSTSTGSAASSLKSETDSATSVATAEAADYQVQDAADATSSVITSQVHAQVLNGTGVAGRASSVAQGLEAGGFSESNISTGNADTSSKTMVYYPADRAQSAAAVAGALGIPSSQVAESSNYSEVTVVIGKDWTSGSLYSSTSASSGASPSPTTAASAPTSSSELNAATTGQCVQVASGDIVN